MSHLNDPMFKWRIEKLLNYCWEGLGENFKYLEDSGSFIFPKQLFNDEFN